MSTDPLRIEPKFGLEKKLKDENFELWSSLVRIIDAATKIWRETKLRWYTDHGISHSERVIQNIEKIIEPLRNELTGEELYILLAACYLHDIGMQYLKIPGKNGPPSLEDVEYIRKEHPKRSAELIRENAVPLDGAKNFPLNITTEFLGAIMAIVQAHGTEYFSECVEKLTNNPPRPNNQNIRGPFLAALLMMGDELDLHEKRSNQCFDPTRSKLENFTAESLLHIYKHHYITSVDLEWLGAGHQIFIRFEFPKDSSDYGEDIKEWVVNKLQIQCHTTEKIFEEQGLSWAHKIKIKKVRDDLKLRRSLPEEARSCLKRIAFNIRLIDREPLVQKLDEYAKGAFDAPEGIHVVCPNNLGESDLQNVMDWFFGYCKCVGTEIEHIDFSDSMESLGKDDIKERIDNLLESGKKGILVVYIFRNMGYEMNEGMIKSLLTDGLSKLFASENEHPCAAVICTGFNDTSKLNRDDIRDEYCLNNFTEEQMHKYLEEKLGCMDIVRESMVHGMRLEETSPFDVIMGIDKARKEWVEEV